MATKPSNFAGGNRKVRRSVRVADQVSSLVINGGGSIVLLSVLGIFAYLAFVVVPLFAPGDVGAVTISKFESGLGVPILDPYNRAIALIGDDGQIRQYEINSGTSMAEPRWISEGQRPTVLSVNRNGDLVAAGFSDGTVRVGSIRFRESILAGEPPVAGQSTWVRDGDFFEVIGPGRLRRSTLDVQLGDPVELSEGQGAVIRLEYQIDTTGRQVLVAVRADGTVLVNTIRQIRPLGGGTPRIVLTTTPFHIELETIARWYFVTSDGNHVLSVSEAGVLRRYTKSGSTFEFIEAVQAVAEGRRATAATMILGGASVLIGDDKGTVYSWHVATGVIDGVPGSQALARAHAFSGVAGGVIDIAPSLRDRTIIILGKQGGVRVRHVTSEKIIADFDSGFELPASARLAPKNDAIVVLDASGRIAVRDFEEGYPEFSVKALFGKVHYEGQLDAQYVYQSSSGSDSAETKLSVIPLIFGSLKATIFAMLFAVPVGVLAAVYTSEFLGPGVRKMVKPGVEMMASLPSVVLGFVAAIIVAPFVAELLPSVLVLFATLPIAVLFFAHVWQMVPKHVRARFSTWQQLSLVLLACGLGVMLARAMGPWFEAALFAPDAGSTVTEIDIRRWLNREYGQAWPGWFVVLLGPVALVLVVAQSMFLTRRLDRMLAGQREAIVSGVMLARFTVMLALTFAGAILLALTLQSLGYDPRDSIFGTFSQRNTLIVSMIMGFAVIPIIYTISEDSLRAVPDSLRTASLGAGATPWQTAMRIVIPVAGSGIFSACMIGFGRAAGETMIVLMATGNTPEMSWNIFGGFRTLSANIAVELPEAPKGSTHYRVLFLCGLVLFVMTFAINTAAEVVRQIVRSRIAGL